MRSLTKEEVKEIADMIDCGHLCYWHKKTGELFFIIDDVHMVLEDDELHQADLKKLEDNFHDYIEIEKPESRDSFMIMEDFVMRLEGNDHFKLRLINALNKKKPFREFKFLVDNSGIYREQWFAFKNERMKQWVIEKFERAIACL
jgi:hypothetical protein